MILPDPNPAHPLAQAAYILEDAGADAAPQPAMLLAALGYAVVDAGTFAATTPTGSDLQRHRSGLLRLGARIGDVFNVPSPNARGVTIQGARHDGLPGFAGRGLTRQGAFESCMGEAAEYLSFLQHADDPLIRDGMVMATDLSDRSEHKVEAPLVLRHRDAPRATSSTGTGAGASLEAAQLSALSEVVERDAVARWWRGGAVGRQMPMDDAFLSVTRAGFDRRTWLLDLTPPHGIPVVGAFSAEPDGRAVISGYASRATVEEAAQTALLELFQMEVAAALALRRRKQVGEAALQAEERLWIDRCAKMTLADCPQFEGEVRDNSHAVPVTTADPLAAMVVRLTARNHQCLSIDITRPELGIPVARVLVAGFQDMNASAGDCEVTPI